MLNHRGQLTAFKRLSVNQIRNFRACANLTPNNARIMIPICKHMHPKCDVSTTFSLSLWPPSLPTMSRRHFAIGRTPCLARKDSPSPPSRPQRDMICESRNVRAYINWLISYGRREANSVSVLLIGGERGHNADWRCWTNPKRNGGSAHFPRVLANTERTSEHRLW